MLVFAPVPGITSSYSSKHHALGNKLHGPLNIASTQTPLNLQTRNSLRLMINRRPLRVVGKLDVGLLCNFGQLLSLSREWPPSWGAGMIKGDSICRASGTSCGPKDVAAPIPQLLCPPPSPFPTTSSQCIIQTGLASCLFIMAGHTYYIFQNNHCLQDVEGDKIPVCLERRIGGCECPRFH